MIERGDAPRDLRSLTVPRAGSPVEAGDPWEPYRLADPAGLPVGSVAAYLMDLQAAGRPATTQRSYGMDLLRWFRFLWVAEVPWNEATRTEARDFSWWKVPLVPAEPVTARRTVGNRVWFKFRLPDSENVTIHSRRRKRVSRRRISFHCGSPGQGHGQPSA
ncbi:hypothetical protein GCM10009665_60690 [Kitasatospora nipponensis]|uniref:Phage integrase family protein with SAM-like domain n=1 Tax=Kitasatospora nipponensis TaxID=258049 RepID=A0ABN1WSF0_9ACTN